MVMQNRHYKTIRFFLLLFVLSALVVAPLVGEKNISLIRALADWQSLDASVLFSLRFPRIVFAFLVGGGLAMIGAVFQALLRNDLATPYTLGVSSGGALGAVIAIKIGLDVQLLGFSAIALSSVAGSMLTLLIIYKIAQMGYGASEYSLILAGVTVNLTFSALILFIHYLADFTETFRMVHWLMGNLSITGWRYPTALMIFLLPVAVYFLNQTQALNIITMGRDLAQSKGVDTVRLQTVSLIAGSVLVGIVVSMAGPIGFIGLVIPHSLRLLAGPDHRRMLPLSLLIGGAFLVWCDTIARSIIYPTELPVGIITSLLGGPFFIYLLVRLNKQNRGN